jgi:hypothetical protein
LDIVVCFRPIKKHFDLTFLAEADFKKKYSTRPEERQSFFNDTLMNGEPIGTSIEGF